MLSSRGQVAVDRAAGLADGEQAAERPPGDQPPAGGPAQSAVSPVDDRVLGPGRAVDEGDVDRAAPGAARRRPGRARESWSISRSRRSIRSFGLSPSDDEGGDRVVQARELGRDLGDLAARRRRSWLYSARGGVLRGDRSASGRRGSSRSARRPAGRAPAWRPDRRATFARSDQDCQNFDELGVDARVGRLVERELGAVAGPRRAPSSHRGSCSARGTGRRGRCRGRGGSPGRRRRSRGGRRHVAGAAETGICCAGDADSSASWRE